MTTIAVKAGRMAGDRLAYLGKGEAGHARKTKIHRLGDDSLVGICTSVVGAATQLLEWIEQGYPPDAAIVTKEVPDSFSILLLRRDGSMLYWHDGFWPQPVEADCMAIGSGAAYALGAMEVGATAIAAVRAAARFDRFTSSEVEQMSLAEEPGHEA